MQKPKTWRLRNLLGDLSGKEEMLHHSKPKQRHWVSQALQLSGQQSCFQLLMRGRTPARAGEHHEPTVPPFYPWCWLVPRHPFRADTWLTQQHSCLEQCPGTTGANLPFVCRATWNNIQGNLERGFDLSFLAWTRHCCQYRLFSPISMIDAPAKNIVLVALVHICHHHLLFVGMNMYYKEARFRGKKKNTSPTF